MTEREPAEVVYTLVCTACDAGELVESPEAALAAGWIDVRYALERPLAYYIGICPECRLWLPAYGLDG